MGIIKNIVFSLLKFSTGRRIDMDDKDSKLLQLNPFELNWKEENVACVGDNGGTSNDSILMGYRSAAKLIIENIKDGKGTEDELIYPLVFSIRHCVELAIKISIDIIKNIYEKKNKVFPIEDKKIHIHDIKELSNHLKRICEIDCRFKELYVLPLKFAEDYYFDEKADVFRYERNREGKELLKILGIEQISIGILEKKFFRMYELFETAIYSLVKYKSEYETNTYTKNLSRYDIEQISNELLPFDRWREDDFRNNKAEIMKKYEISSNEFSKAIDFIKRNALFASNVGISIKLGCITEEELIAYANLVAAFFNKSDLIKTEIRAGEGMEELLKKLPNDSKKQKSLSEAISDDALYSLVAFGDMKEREDLYCENYQLHFNLFKQNENIRRDWLIRKIKNIWYALKILAGMKICGQIQYISVLKPLIAEIDDEICIE